MKNNDYEGVKFYFEYAKVDEAPDGQVSLSFHYQVVSNPMNIDYENDVDFKNILGDILVSLIEDGVTDENDRKDNIESPSKE